MLGLGSALVLAASGEEQKAGPLALAVILVLAIACYFLFRSMTRHLRKVRTQFPTDGPPPTAAAPSPPDINAESDPAEPTAPTPAPRDRPASTDPPNS